MLHLLHVNTECYVEAEIVFVSIVYASVVSVGSNTKAKCNQQYDAQLAHLENAACASPLCNTCAFDKSDVSLELFCN